MIWILNAVGKSQKQVNTNSLKSVKRKLFKIQSHVVINSANNKLSLHSYTQIWTLDKHNIQPIKLMFLFRNVSKEL